ncbi:hypothetical protein LCGC14_0587940 [marine sediment metagenome]|uniref:Uncharacterized protein n=1 Tax=marine sediment metagenome TaxID=412755 RepID=A0A0F9U0N4_9ZZZZ
MDTELEDASTVTISNGGLVAEPQISELECARIGGHCWAEAPYVLTSNPPQYDRSCKHCGKRQRGTTQPGMVWSDL